MKRYNNLIRLFALVVAFLMGPFLNAQSQLIDSLKKEIFPEGKTIGLQHEFVWENQTYQIHARDFEPNMKKINELLLQIRELKDTNLISQLLEIQKEHEYFFLKEWEPSYRIWYYKFNEQYSILMNLELTMGYLYSLATFDNSTDRYEYFKNLIYLQWIDYDFERAKNYHFYSNYFRGQFHGACLSSDFCSVNLLKERSQDFEDGILKDLQTFKADSLSEKEKNYYLTSLGQAAINLKSDKVEDIYISRIKEFDKIGEKFDSCCHPMILYNVLGMRGRKNGVEFLLNDLSSEELVKASPFYIERLSWTNLGKKMCSARILMEIEKSNDLTYKKELTEKYSFLTKKNK